HGHVQNRADPGLAEPAEPFPRGRHLGLGIPATEAGPPLLKRLRPDEHVLVHEHDTEVTGVDVTSGGGDGRHDLVPPATVCPPWSVHRPAAGVSGCCGPAWPPR